MNAKQKPESKNGPFYNTLNPTKSFRAQGLGPKELHCRVLGALCVNFDNSLAPWFCDLVLGLNSWTTILNHEALLHPTNFSVDFRWMGIYLQNSEQKISQPLPLVGKQAEKK